MVTYFSTRILVNNDKNVSQTIYIYTKMFVDLAKKSLIIIFQYSIMAAETCSLIFIYIYIYIYIYMLMNPWTFTNETEISNLIVFITII